MKESDSENMPEQEGVPPIEDIPTIEDVEEELGLDAMDFFSSMVRPDPRDNDNEDEDETPQLTQEESRVVEDLERDKGRRLTREEVHLSLEQARHLGFL